MSDIKTSKTCEALDYVARFFIWLGWISDYRMDDIQEAFNEIDHPAGWTVDRESRVLDEQGNWVGILVPDYWDDLNLGDLPIPSDDARVHTEYFREEHYIRWHQRKCVTRIY